MSATEKKERKGPLTNQEIAAAKPKEKPYKLADERQLYMLIAPNGTRSWRLNYTFAGPSGKLQQKTLHLGRFPDVTLKRVREKAHDARALLADGKDPGAERQSIVAARVAATDGATVEQIGAALFTAPPGQEVAAGTSMAIIDGKARRPKWLEDRQRMARHIYPTLGKRPIAGVKWAELDALLQKILEAGHRELARRVRFACSKLWAFAKNNRKCPHNIVADCQTIKRTPKKERKHLASIREPRRYGDLLRSIDGYEGRTQPATECALQVAPVLVLRSSELRWMRWGWVDFDAAEIRVPPTLMKRTDPHLIPLPRQTLAILRDHHTRIGGEADDFVFPGLRGDRPISENTLLMALRVMGFRKEEMSVHGVRSFFSTQLREHNWKREACEVQIAHMTAEGGETEEAYNYALYLPYRRVMMQWWADYLDSLKLRQSKPKIPHAGIAAALAGCDEDDLTLDKAA